jgi:hypothetical protein
VQGIRIEALESELEGDIDLRGFLGLATVSVTTKVSADAGDVCEGGGGFTHSQQLLLPVEIAMAGMRNLEGCIRTRRLLCACKITYIESD